MPPTVRLPLAVLAAAVLLGLLSGLAGVAASMRGTEGSSAASAPRAAQTPGPADGQRGTQRGAQPGAQSGAQGAVQAGDETDVEPGVGAGVEAGVQVGAEPEAIAALRAWDRRRARAYAHDDGAGLARLYVPGSRTGAADLAVLAGYHRRGLRVTGMRTQLLAAGVLRQSATRTVLRVTDVLTGALATDGRHRWPLPRDRPSTRRVVLLRNSSGWCVDEVYDPP